MWWPYKYSVGYCAISAPFMSFSNLHTCRKLRRGSTGILIQTSDCGAPYSLWRVLADAQKTEDEWMSFEVNVAPKSEMDHWTFAWPPSGWLAVLPRQPAWAQLNSRVHKPVRVLISPDHQSWSLRPPPCRNAEAGGSAGWEKLVGLFVAMRWTPFNNNNNNNNNNNEL